MGTKKHTHTHAGGAVWCVYVCGSGLSEFPHISASLRGMPCYFAEAAPHGDATCTLMKRRLSAGEHMDEEEEGEDGETRVRRPEWGLLSQPLTSRHMEVGEGGGGARVLHSLLLPSSTCQRLSQSPQTGKTEVFSPLRRYQEIIICCSAFHAHNQERASQTTKQASARRDGGGGRGCMEKKYVFLLRETAGPRVAELICFWKNALVASSICSARNQERWC